MIAADTGGDAGRDAGRDAVDVHIHVHRVVTGTAPLRVADLLFTGRELLVPEYAHLTPFGLARGRVPAMGERARRCFDEGGVPGLVEFARRTVRVDYDELTGIRLHAGRVGRPKVAVEVRSGPPYAYRAHAPVDVDALAGALRSLGGRREFRVERHATLGFDPLNGVRRFLAGR